MFKIILLTIALANLHSISTENAFYETCFKPSSLNTQCKDDFSFMCGYNYCSKDSFSCARFVLNSLLHFRLGEKKISQKSTRIKSNNIKQINLKKCPFKANSIHDDVCVNKKKCLYKPQIWSLSYIKKIWKECPCKDPFPHNCGYGLCARVKQACSSLIKKHKINNLVLKECDK